MTNTKKLWENTILTADALSCRRGGRLVFDALSFSLKSGDFLHLAGSNGSGKTTLLRSLGGLLPPISGCLHLNGSPVQGSDIGHSRAFLYAGHQPGLKNILSLRDNSVFFCQLMTGSVPDEGALHMAADTLGLAHLLDQPLKYFSSGQTHRASLMRFLLVPRAVWLMDEPTVGLDSENRARLQGVMQGHLAAGGILIAASHDALGLSGQALNMADFAPTSAETIGYWA